MASIKKGDKVTCSAQYTYDGKTHLASFVRTNTFDVISVSGDRVVIGKGSAVTAAVKASTLTVVGGNGKQTTKKTETKNVKPKKTTTKKVAKKKDDSMDSAGIEKTLANMISNGGANDRLNYSMRLFGIPHQYTKYCDYRGYSDDTKQDSYLSIGRKFIENIMLEAPVVTIVPGKPLYLPGDKDKESTSYALLSAANGAISSMVAEKTVKKNAKDVKYKRYFDFQQDYINYMRYVNILCGVGAAFLDLDKEKDYADIVGFDGVTPFTNYDWKQYRWNASGYKTATGNMLSASKKAVTSWVNKLKTYGGEKVVKAYNKTSKKNNGGLAAFNDKQDQSILDTLETLLTQINFVQFYVDPTSGLTESNQNGTTSSKLEGMFESGQDLFKEVAFIANSGGIDSAEVQKMIAEGADTLNSKLFQGQSTAGSLMSRLTSGVTNVIRGDNMIFPEIYQNSKYEKSYSISIDLRTPYGNKLSYYINVLVPLFHLIALAVPKQSTANSYSSPFLIKAYYPGVFSCNLGIVEGLAIEKNPNGDSWTVDGLPSHIKVTLSIKDLYADLAITPAGDFTLFISNSSLIEYIATCCGINLTTPQLANRVTTIASALKQSFKSVPDTVNMSIFGSLENWIASLMGV